MQEWGSALAVIGNLNALWASNVSWHGTGAAIREAAVRTAMTGQSAGGFAAWQ